MLCGLLPTLVSLIILALLIPAYALYNMDDTNSSIVYTGSKWSPVQPNTQPWVESGGVFFASLMHSVCETADNCSVGIPFTGSGITVHNVIRSSVNISITIDGGSPTSFSFSDDNSCLNTTKFGCFNTTIYDVQSLASGNHRVDITMFTVAPSARNLTYSDFYLDYVTVNETDKDAASATPIISPNPASSPTSSTSTNPSMPTMTTNKHPHKPPLPPIIVACVVGLLVFIPSMVFIVFCTIRRTWPCTYIRDLWRSWRKPKSANPPL